MKKPDSVIFKRHLMKLSLEELTAYLKEYEKVRQVKVLDQINQMKQEEIQTKLEVLAPVSACPSCNSDNFVKNGSKYGLQRYYCKNCETFFVFITFFNCFTNFIDIIRNFRKKDDVRSTCNTCMKC